jgi:hypothetical protein
MCVEGMGLHSPPPYTDLVTFPDGPAGNRALEYPTGTQNLLKLSGRRTAPQQPETPCRGASRAAQHRDHIRARSCRSSRTR